MPATHNSKEVETFFREHPIASASRAVEQSLERIRGNIQFLNKNREVPRKLFSLSICLTARRILSSGWICSFGSESVELLCNNHNYNVTLSW